GLRSALRFDTVSLQGVLSFAFYQTLLSPKRAFIEEACPGSLGGCCMVVHESLPRNGSRLHWNFPRLKTLGDIMSNAPVSIDAASVQHCRPALSPDRWQSRAPAPPSSPLHSPARACPHADNPC